MEAEIQRIEFSGAPSSLISENSCNESLTNKQNAFQKYDEVIIKESSFPDSSTDAYRSSPMFDNKFDNGDDTVSSPIEMAMPAYVYNELKDIFTVTHSENFSTNSTSDSKIEEDCVHSCGFFRILQNICSMKVGVRNKKRSMKNIRNKNSSEIVKPSASNECIDQSELCRNVGKSDFEDNKSISEQRSYSDEQVLFSDNILISKETCNSLRQEKSRSSDKAYANMNLFKPIQQDNIGILENRGDIRLDECSFPPQQEILDDNNYTLNSSSFSDVNLLYQPSIQCQDSNIMGVGGDSKSYSTIENSQSITSTESIENSDKIAHPEKEDRTSSQ